MGEPGGSTGLLGALLKTRATAPRGATRATAITMAILPLLLIWLVGPTQPGVWAYAAVAVCAPLLTAVDLIERRLPDVITLPLAGACALVFLATALDTGDWGRLGGALAGGLAMSAFFFVLFLMAPASLGFGDVKLALSLGQCLGWIGVNAVIVGTLASLLLALLVGVALMLVGRATWKSSIALGPYLLAGTLGTIVVLA